MLQRISYCRPGLIASLFVHAKIRMPACVMQYAYAIYVYTIIKYRGPIRSHINCVKFCFGYTSLGKTESHNPF